MVAGDEDGDGAHGIKERDLVDVADKVAGHGFKEADGASRALDDADAGDALAGGTAVPESLKQGEVAPVKEEDQEKVESGCPLCRDAIEGRDAGQEEGEDPHHQAHADKPDDVVDQKRDEAAADTGEGHLDGDKLRGIDAKLI